MTASNRRTLVRVIAIGFHWVFLVFALGSLVIRSDTAFDDVISPHLGSAPMFVGAFVAGALLGMTIESLKALVPMTILLAIGAACFVGIVNYAPVIDGVLMRTTALDNYVSQRVIIVTMIITLGAAPGAVAGNLLGAALNVRHEIMPDPKVVAEQDEVPWWERRQHQNRDQQHTP